MAHGSFIEKLSSDPTITSPEDAEAQIWVRQGSADMKYVDGNGTIQTVGRSGSATQKYPENYNGNTLTLNQAYPLFLILANSSFVSGNWTPMQSGILTSLQIRLSTFTGNPTYVELYQNGALIATSNSVPGSTTDLATITGSFAFASGDTLSWKIQGAQANVYAKEVAIIW